MESVGICGIRRARWELHEPRDSILDWIQALKRKSGCAVSSPHSRSWVRFELRRSCRAIVYRTCFS